MTKSYNTSDLRPDINFENHVFHRDQFAHYLRWSFVMNRIKNNETVVDFGCGEGNLLATLYHNRIVLKEYIGIDIRKRTMERVSEKYTNVPWAHFYIADIVKNTLNYSQFKADKVCAFEILEHVGKQNAHAFLENFKACGNNNATYYLSTPNYDSKIGAAKNHTYDSGDGRGVAAQEFEHWELENILNQHFDIIEKFGTFASIKDYMPHMNNEQKKIFEALNKYYDTQVMAVIMAPMFPQYSRNTLWVLKRKLEDTKQQNLFDDKLM